MSPQISHSAPHHLSAATLKEPQTRVASWLGALCGVGLLMLTFNAAAIEASSPQYRLIGPTAASTSMQTASPNRHLRWVGGSGQAIGLAASPNRSLLSGAASLQLPTNRIFRDGLEN